MKIMQCNKCGAKVTVYTAHYVKGMHGVDGTVPTRLKTKGNYRLCEGCADKLWQTVRNWVEDETA